MLLRVIFPRKPVSVTLLITNLTSASKKESKVLIMESQASHVLPPVYLPRVLSLTAPLQMKSVPWPLWTLTSVCHLLFPHSSHHTAAFVWSCAPLPPFQPTRFSVTSAARGMGHTIRSMLTKCFTLSRRDW